MSKLIRGVNDFESWCNNNNRLDLLSEWDYSKNEPLIPKDVPYGTAKKFWWIGKCGHNYQASMNARTSSNSACPYCCNSHAKLLKGFNDLETTNPELLSSWDYEKNNLTPQDVMKGQHIKIWWKCPVGHSYQSALYHRVQGNSCPVCRRESQTSFPEQALFYYIKNVFPDSISSDRKVLNGKELDIYIPSIQFAIEFDGSKWHKSIEKDVYKNALCKQEGISLIRIRDVECPLLPEEENVYIILHEKYTDAELTRCIFQVAGILGISLDVDLDRDRVLIYNQYYYQKKEKSLAESYPELCKEWNYKKNGELKPELITRKSDKKVWWVCEHGHEWLAAVSSRTQMHSGCPHCSGRIVSGNNDLLTKYPELCLLFDSDKNGILPSEVSSSKQSSYYWRCYKGHSYKKHLYTMQKHLDDLDNMCPFCTGEVNGKPTPRKYEGRSYTIDKSHPDCINEWDYENNDIQPEEVTCGSAKKVWWKCSNGHSYLSSVSNHLFLQRGCPYCSGKKVLKGFNDLETQFPDLIKEWDFDKNTIKPNEVSGGSRAIVWWKCSKGHSYKTYVYQRTAGHGCPTCAGCKKRVVRNIETGEVFHSLQAAANSCGLKVGDTISLCCKGKMKKAGGYHWEFVEESEQ